jgi:hypothetical protein
MATKQVWTNTYVCASGLRERWFDDLATAQAVLDSIALEHRGPHTLHAPLLTCPRPGMWRVDDILLAGVADRPHGWANTTGYPAALVGRVA